MTKAKSSNYVDWVFDGKCKCGVSVACPRCINIYEQGKKDAEHDMEMKNKYKSTFNYTSRQLDIAKKIYAKQKQIEVLKKVEKEQNRIYEERNEDWMGDSYKLSDFILKELKRLSKDE